MSVADKITRLTTARNDIRTALNNKGANAAEHGFEDFAEDINGLSGGGSLPSLDNIAFGNNPTVPEEGKTASANYEAIAQAIDTVAARTKTFTLDSLTVEEGGIYIPPSGTVYDEVNVNMLSGTPIILDDEDDDEWVRPEGWPDLDNIELEDDFEGLYLTYDLTKTEGYGWIGVYVKTSNNTTYNVKRGHLENNIFVADATNSANSNSYFRQNLDSTYGNIQLWEITPSSGHIINFGFCTNATSNAKVNSLQPCVERYGKLPYWSGLYSSPNSSSSTGQCFSTQWLESDVIEIGDNSNATTLQSLWSMSYNLQRLDVSKWKTTNWHITDISRLFERCYNLKKLNLSAWDTSNWAVTSMNFIWSSCRFLKELNVSNWDTSNWAVISMTSLFNGCINLKELDLSNWNVSNWRPTELSNTWNDCFCLQKLNLSTWDTSNWRVTRLYYIWRNCYSLQSLQISNWNTNNWAITTLDQLFSGCRSLKKIDLSNWDTSNWAVTNLNSAFSGCYNLQQLNLSTWDTSNWAVTTMNYLFYQCYKLKELNVSNWNTSNWAVTTMNSLFNGLSSLKELDLSNWDVSNWRPTQLDNTWNNCVELKELNVSTWDTSDWHISKLDNTWNNCQKLKELNLSFWDTSNFGPSISLNNIFNYCYSLTTLLLPENFSTKSQPPVLTETFNLVTYSSLSFNYNLNLSNYYKLSKQSLLNIINKLPTITVKRTLSLGTTNKSKLTAEEIAVATEKGWTVA